MTAFLALPQAMTPRIVRALETTKKPIVVWLEFQDCAGNTESLLRSSHPTVADVVLDVTVVGVPRDDHGGSGPPGRGDPGQGAQRQRPVHPHGRGIHTHCRERDLLHDRRQDRGPDPPGDGRQREARDRFGCLRLGRGIPAARSDGRRRHGRHHRQREAREPRRVPPQRGEHRGRARALPDVRLGAGSRPVQPPAVRVRAPHPRPVRAARQLRRRPLRGAVGRRGPPQRLVPVQDGLQGTGGHLQLSDRALERRHQLADRRRATAASHVRRRGSGSA